MSRSDDPRLFAVNHALAAARPLGLAVRGFWSQQAFVDSALTAGLADAAANLVQPGGANYDWSVLHYNLERSGLASHPLPPGAVETRLQSPFATHYAEGSSYEAVAYVLRTPQAGGHWVALLPPAVLDMEASDEVAAVLCDSLYAEPFLLSADDTEELLTACALEGVRADAGFGHNIAWGAFLITAPAVALA